MTLTNQNTQPAPSNPLDKFKQQFSHENVKKRFDDVLGAKAPGFVSSVLSAISSNKSLMECQPSSVIAASLISASLDLPINQNLGFAYIVPYKGVAQFQMGWRGYVQLALRTGQYKTINAIVVYKGQIKFNNLMTGEIELDPNGQQDEVAGYMLYFRLINGFEKTVYMTKDECMRHAKKFSQSFKTGRGYWADDFDAMALKTVVKLGLSKWGILSIEMQKAIVTDQSEVDEDGNHIKYPDRSEPKHTPASSLDGDFIDVTSDTVEIV